MFSLTTITHKTSDTAHPCLMLTNRDGSRYLFGKIPEGTQRALNENRFKLGKLKSIFFTGTASTWSELGGLPGLFLTISDATGKNIDVFSSSKLLSYVVATWRYFVFRKGVELKIVEVNENEVISDSNINVTALKVQSSRSLDKLKEDGTENKEVPIIMNRLRKLISRLFPMDTSAVNSDDLNSYKSDPSEYDMHTHVELPDPNIICIPENEPSTSYLVDFVPIRGKFNSKLAIELGIKPGPNFRKLTEGIPVENEKGELIAPDRVMGESRFFPKLLVLDIPDMSYLRNTIKKISNTSDILLVYHFLADDVDYASDEYIRFMQSFDSNCKHVISHKSVAADVIVFKTSAINILKLKALQADCFNLPCTSKTTKASINKELTLNCTPLHQLQQFEIEPSDAGSSFTVKEINGNLDGTKSWSDLYEENVVPLNVKNISKDDTINSQPISLGPIEGTLKDQVQIMTLGTGSALPSMFRNVISTLVRIPFVDDGAVKFRSILLDAGENTLGTMVRNFGHNNEEQLTQVFKEMGIIYLSHLHADHHLGIVSIVKKWFEVNNDNKEKILYLVTPWQYNNFISEWFKVERDDSDLVDFSRVSYLSCEDFLLNEAKSPEFKRFSMEEFEKEFDSNNLNRKMPRAPLQPTKHEIIQQLRSDYGLESIATCRAIHCHWAYSVTLNFILKKGESNPSEHFKVSYSGDTRPNIEFANIGYGSDLLIHESSLAEDLIEEALSKKHSTMIEAVTMSKLMRCPKIILTHFSTRYSNRADLSVDSESLYRLGMTLKNYLNEHGLRRNIMSYDEELKTGSYQKNSDALSYSDLDICYAFDMMTIRYKSLQSSKFNYNEMLQMFESEALEKNSGDAQTVELKRMKQLERHREKTEAKRDKRLGKKKRRTSDDESSS
ncbi:ribonuclease Z [[Candida] railenensis]|uniref:ribonuclease Z n=1 Tax=[Candida] railenensis TaxID=45579 RepID=A0A9P0QSI1_9ASCO|nr:ribonuclease Z [[Candida] railenensis]